MPRRIFTVSGMPAGRASRTRPTIESAVSGSLNRKPPRQRPNTFFTGQAKFRSITSKPAATSFSAAGGNSSGRAPINCAPQGCSSSVTWRNRSRLAALGDVEDELIEHHLADGVRRAQPAGDHPHRPVAVAAQRRLDDGKVDGQGAYVQSGEYNRH